jgi:secretion/DNA translocation related TadE-like protein
MSGRPAGDRGSGSIWVLALGLVVVLAGLVGMYRGSAVVGRHRAEAAADFAALAAAAKVLEGGQVACASAGTVAAANGARLVSCAVDGSIATVTTAVALRGVLPGDFVATGRARAGPAPADDGDQRQRSGLSAPGVSAPGVSAPVVRDSVAR